MVASHASYAWIETQVQRSRNHKCPVGSSGLVLAQLLLAVELLVNPSRQHPAWQTRSCRSQGSKLCQALVPMYMTAILARALSVDASVQAVQLFTFQLGASCLAPIACRCIRPGAYSDLGPVGSFLTVLGDVSAATVVALTLKPILWQAPPIFIVAAALLCAFTTAAAHHVTLVHFPKTFTEGEAWLVVAATVNSLMWLAFSWTSRVQLPATFDHLSSATIQIVAQLDTLPIVATLTTVLFCCAVAPPLHDLVTYAAQRTAATSTHSHEPGVSHGYQLRPRKPSASERSQQGARHSANRSPLANGRTPSESIKMPLSDATNGNSHAKNANISLKSSDSTRIRSATAHDLHLQPEMSRARCLMRVGVLGSAYACVMIVCALYTLQYVFERAYRIYTVLAWAGAMMLGVPGMMVVASWELVTHVVLRKGFHLLTLAMFVPVLVADPPLLAIALAVAFVIMALCELVRGARVPWISGVLSHVVEKFTDSRDEGVFLVSHMSLLMGIAVPLWISIAEPTGSLSGKPFIVELMPGWSGLVALGISDTTAAVVGTKYGRTKVHRTSSKSVEGLLSGTVAMVVMLGSVAVYGGMQRDWLWWGCLLWYSLLTCTLEAVTLQLDNFVFPWHACTLMTLLS